MYTTVGLVNRWFRLFFQEKGIIFIRICLCFARDPASAAKNRHNERVHARQMRMTVPQPYQNFQAFV